MILSNSYPNFHPHTDISHHVYYTVNEVWDTDHIMLHFQTNCLDYSVPHEESKRMLGMCDVTSIAVMPSKMAVKLQISITQRGTTLVAVYGSRGDR